MVGNLKSGGPSILRETKCRQPFCRQRQTRVLKPTFSEFRLLEELFLRRDTMLKQMEPREELICRIESEAYHLGESIDIQIEEFSSVEAKIAFHHLGTPSYDPLCRGDLLTNFSSQRYTTWSQYSHQRQYTREFNVCNKIRHNCLLSVENALCDDMLKYIGSF
ncbi:hypothetical protein PROFUN_07902 [Planoprotostelium fungivorum]|uniref:Uncharacterized protein n=1 Tax=Planoprotostelium fungivorum TaxID=1890364 RepID=A0A2P6NL63_9EUKA|nr:hypothetical protein PROFUN_07902 [Planoprotostelium fungivorum]